MSHSRFFPLGLLFYPGLKFRPMFAFKMQGRHKAVFLPGIVLCLFVFVVCSLARDLTSSWCERLVGLECN